VGDAGPPYGPGMTDPHPQRTPAASRRQLITLAGLGLVGPGLGRGFLDGAAAAAPAVDAAPLGPLRPAGPELALPKGFSYRTFGRAGETMSDGLPTPRCHDGQALFRTGRRGRLRLLRNHEIDLDIPGTPQRAIGRRRAYDRAAPGGVTSSLYDDERGLVESALVLNGTLSNCSGSPTPWGTWLSCEETTEGKGAGYERPHGYVFEVPGDAHGPVEPVPIRAMGRFEHECAPVDPHTGVVYMTEDNGDPGDGFYRFLPDRPGRLQHGGRLQMLAIDGEPRYDTASGQRVGETLPCHWVDIRHPDPSDAEDVPGAVYLQGRRRGGARFLGLEGAVWHEDGVVFVASEAGDAEQGQVWRYEPVGDHRGRLRLLYESRSEKVLNQPDAIEGNRHRLVVMAEDGDGDDPGGTNFLRVLTPRGQVVDLARVIEPLDLHYWAPEDYPEPGPTGASEMAGPRWSPDGRRLFVNVQYPGVTCVITGPWHTLR
jgi:uncharacterized protein